LVPTIKVFGKTFSEYLLLELNYVKLRKIQENTDSRGCAEAGTGLPFRKVSNRDLERVISETKKEFLNKVR